MDRKKPYWIVLADTQIGDINWQNLVREQDYYTAFQTQCQAAAETPECLGIIGLGDLRERASFQAKNLGGLNRGLKTLAEAGKPLLALMGNHDYTEPNWIEEMCYPSLHDLTKPEVQEKFGFDPETTYATHYTPKHLLMEKLKAARPEHLRLIFLHQALRELTTSLKQSYDISLETLREIGVGKNHPCLILLGDLHNYGDTKLGNITAAYPGSLEMTDANEGANGLRSERIATNPHDYRKFVIHLDPMTLEWEPQEVKARPWMRRKAKTKRDADLLELLILEESKTWQIPACVSLSVPKSEKPRFEALLGGLPILEARIEEYRAEADEEERTAPDLEGTLSWAENKRSLVRLAENDLDPDAMNLLKEIVASDGSTHSPKTDVLSAWERWTKQTTPNTEK